MFLWTLLCFSGLFSLAPFLFLGVSLSLWRPLGSSRSWAAYLFCMSSLSFFTDRQWTTRSFWSRLSLLVLVVYFDISSFRCLTPSHSLCLLISKSIISLVYDFLIFLDKLGLLHFIGYLNQPSIIFFLFFYFYWLLVMFRESSPLELFCNLSWYPRICLSFTEMGRLSFASKLFYVFVCFFKIKKVGRFVLINDKVYNFIN